ncbi:NUDIX domain-containing protein [Jiangella rhizosphaerae]|uniref:Nudix hydrolase domain-containing protein n=1 Tax=Jiangella rhizosphaerae TaxID=2293569 RepID=A0A418KTE0_9ACTN|nr:NUDIX domain-containing protein [Jiangella rhizosphaerae]RIQ28595.1 hypothetical protein DY240_08940 [Jiangella rhizosphaerae]
MTDQGVRVRCAGLLVRDGHVLVESLVGAGRWSPIGGGLQPGETVPEAIVREFREDHQELAWIPLSGLADVVLLPHHLSEEIPTALETGRIVFRSERRVPVMKQE